ncbi:hypothetical protein BJV78DRAFT_1151838 [Lactifluus subvellereus]|nr:hypothetical protein BJV78DRAFT_1151838 [Lactifluus subvellereus]
MADHRSYPSPQCTPYRGGPSTPSKLSRPLPVKSSPASQVLPQTPRRGRSSLGTSPGLQSPQNSPLTYSDGTPVKLYTPKQYAEMAARRAASRPRPPSATGLQGRRLFPSSRESPTRRLVASAREAAGRSRAFGDCPPDSITNDPASPRDYRRSRPTTPSSLSTGSPALAPAPLLGSAIIHTGRRERPPTRPTVRLLSVLAKCWDDDTEKEVQWMIRDGLLGGRLDPRESTDIWGNLHYAIHHVWPTLHKWIMAYVPNQKDAHWFGRAETLRADYYDWVVDPNLAQKKSSTERIGFSMSPEAFESASALIQELAARRDNIFDHLLKAEINPFFMIYAFADSEVSLPDGFSRQLFWKHLDAILTFQHWKGLDYTRELASGSTGPRRATLSRFRFPPEDDPEDIVGKLAALKQTGKIPPTPEPLGLPVHALRLAVYDDYWGARSEQGTFWYQMSGMSDEDAAPYALLDVFTRWLPEWRGGVVKVSTSDVCLMWGLRSERPGAWLAVRALCKEFHVELRDKYLDPLENSLHLPEYRAERATPAPPRDPKIVDAAVRELMRPELSGNKSSGVMLRHLMMT